MDSDKILDCEDKLSKVNIHYEGRIEEAKDCLMVNFANEYIGGGCMQHGRVQEEILFLIYPEFYFCTLLFPKMLNNEAIVVRGLKRYSSYKGYGNDLKFAKEYEDGCQLDDGNILETTFTCMDALRFKKEKQKRNQYDEDFILRELNKAYIGFQGSSSEEDQDEKMPVSTGNWGCGEFGGNVELKFLIQWMAATMNGRDVEYYTFEDMKCEHLENILKIYQDKAVKDVYQDLLNHKKELSQKISLK